LKYKAVIFDLDGTLTEPFLDFNRIRVEIGLKADSGPLLEQLKDMDTFKRRRAEEILLKYEKQAAMESVLNYGARETLDELKDRGFHIGILTRNTYENALFVAAKHKLNFDVIVDREAGPVKPDPFGVEHICRKFNIATKDSIVVGDYLFDLMSAKAAGADAVLLRNHKTDKEFEKYADHCIDKLEELLEIVDGNGKV
jgi:HAD superfamily hydrolase (TIGR01509 family)